MLVHLQSLKVETAVVFKESPEMFRLSLGYILSGFIVPMQTEMAPITK